MKHTITVEFESLYPLATDQWEGIKRAIHAQVYEEFGVIPASVDIKGIPNVLSE
jgi:hypothetical protein